jgi:hypothetical protein
MTSVTHVPGLFCYPCPRLHLSDEVVPFVTIISDG